MPLRAFARRALRHADMLDYAAMPLRCCRRQGAIMVMLR